MFRVLSCEQVNQSAVDCVRHSVSVFINLVLVQCQSAVNGKCLFCLGNETSAVKRLKTFLKHLIYSQSYKYVKSISCAPFFK